MTALLILLALLSLGTIASRKGFAVQLSRAAGTPLLVGVGYFLLSPSGLAFVDPETTQSLRPALRIGCAWLGLMLGLSAPGVPTNFQTFLGPLRAIAASSWCWIVTAAATFITMVAARTEPAGWQMTWGQLTPIGIAFVVAGLVQASGTSRARSTGLRSGLTGKVPLYGDFAPHDEVAGVIALCAALVMWPIVRADAPIYQIPIVAVVTILALGAALALIQVMATRGEQRGEPRVIALLGTVTILTGLAASTSLPEVAIAYFFGLALSQTSAGRYLRRRLAATERPVRLVVLVLTGLHLGLEPLAVTLGAVAAAARVLAKVALLPVLSRHNGLSAGRLIQAPKLAIPLAVSFALAQQVSLPSSGVIAAVVVAIALTDLISTGLLLLETATPAPAELSTGS